MSNMIFIINFMIQFYGSEFLMLLVNLVVNITNVIKGLSLKRFYYFRKYTFAIHSVFFYNVKYYK